jgi:hypothetical protein
MEGADKMDSILIIRTKKHGKRTKKACEDFATMPNRICSAIGDGICKKVVRSQYH